MKTRAVRVLLAVVVGAAAWCVGVGGAVAAPGDLGATFGTGGIVTTVIGAGYSHNGSDNDFAVARYLAGSVPTNPIGVYGLAGDGQVALSWYAPSGAPSTPVITDYVVEYSSDGGMSWAVFADGVSVSRSAVVVGLSNGTGYEFQVSATNSAGTGPPGGTVAPVVPAALPGAPTGVTGFAGDREVTLSWVTPSSDGGAVVTGYVVEYSSDGGSSWSMETASWLPWVVTGLSNGVGYVFRVSAVNSAGTGPVSVVSAEIVPLSVLCSLVGTPGDDVLVGTSGDDYICGLGGNDKIYGKAGDDTLDGGPGKDTLYGGGGIDMLYGRDGVDVLKGGSGSDRLYGGGGKDRLYGGGGKDILAGGPKKDLLFGRSGKDRLFGGKGNDKLYGGGGGDKLHGQAGNDKLYGGTGKDTLYGRGGADVLKGGPGADKLYGNSGNDRIYGKAGDDRLYGHGGNDRLYGHNGKDRLYGGKGRDLLVGGLKKDRLYGGKGKDTAKKPGLDVLKNIELIIHSTGS
jgi:Ca2+-binding RTX toxin-like protein